jgi:hypothetical protein
MDPPIDVSVTRINSHRWTMGSSIVCEKVTNPESKPSNAISSWQDGGSTFYLRRRNRDDLSALEGDAQVDRIHEGGTSAAVWRIGDNAFCKVHAWCEGLELEANTIRFVTENALGVPVPEVIHSWIDRDLNRTFLITKRVTGQTLEEAWPQLSSSQRTRIAENIARYCVTLATRTSFYFETVTGCGVFEPRLMESAQPSHPTWLPRTLGPFSSEGIVTYMTNMSAEPPPDINAPFILYHADLGPTNIMVSKNGNVITGIIDWESAAYYPRFWVATKPVVASAFWLESTTIEPKLWGELLGQALEAMGYKRLDTVYRNWNNARRL